MNHACLKPILLCADDFGMSSSINASILKLAADGRLSATSCLTRGKAFRQEAQNLATLPVQKGLHLNLTENLCGKEYFQPLSRLIWNCFTRRIDLGALRTEIETQLNLFESAMGSAPDYVDGHQHVHQFPIVRECLISILLRRYGDRRPWLRSTIRGRQQSIPVAVQMKSAVIEHLGARAFRKVALPHGFTMNARLLGVYGFDGGEAGFYTLLDSWIRNANTNDLVMLHPAHGTDMTDPMNPQRQAEHAVLSGPLLPMLLQRHRAYVARTLSS